MGTSRLQIPLTPDIERRINSGAHFRTAPSVARRDLGRYYRLLGLELERLRGQFSEAEVMALVGAQDWPADPPEQLADRLEESGAGAFERHGVDRAALVGKVRALSPGALVALVDARERAMRRARVHHGGDLRAAAREAGLI